MCKIERTTVTFTQTYAAVCSSHGVSYFGGKPECVQKDFTVVSAPAKVVCDMSADRAPIRIPFDSASVFKKRSHGFRGKKPTYAKHMRESVRAYSESVST